MHFSGHCDSKTATFQRQKGAIFCLQLLNLLITPLSKRLKPPQLLLFHNAYTRHVLLCHGFDLGHLAMDVKFRCAPNRPWEVPPTFHVGLSDMASKALRFLDMCSIGDGDPQDLLTRIQKIDWQKTNLPA